MGKGGFLGLGGSFRTPRNGSDRSPCSLKRSEDLPGTGQSVVCMCRWLRGSPLLLPSFLIAFLNLARTVEQAATP